MPTPNQNKEVAELHRQAILRAAEQVFLENGFRGATISDISNASHYSRRTLYAYFDSKEDILHHIVLQGLLTLKGDLHRALSEDADFLDQYTAICAAMRKYHGSSPQSFESVNQADATALNAAGLPEAVKQILAAGTEINDILSAYVESGKERGIVRPEVEPLKTVYVMWSSISSLLTLVQTKGAFLERQFSATSDEFLDYGLRQILNSILVERI